MLVDRIERHDIVNAVMLAGVLLLLGFGILTAVNSLFSTVHGGLVDATKPTVASQAVDPPATTAAEPGATAPAQDGAGDVPAGRPPAEVKVRVGNGARRPGVAGAGTEALHKAGYPTLAPKNGPTMDDSVVYYTTDYATEATAVAVALGLPPTSIAPIPNDPGLPVDDANVVAILGVNSEY